MSRSRSGSLTGNKERGHKARKEEDRLRGLNNKARRETIEEQVSEIESDEPDA